MLSLDEVRQRLRVLGARPVHEREVLRRWTHAVPFDAAGSKRTAEAPARLRAALPGLRDDLATLARLHSEHPGADGTRLLVGLNDGQMIESVLLPKGGLCVSTQVGCAVGCTFCMTGRSGLLRQVTDAEMVAQVALARAMRAVTKVVFMGMGEPAHNLEHVCSAIDLLGTVGGIGHKNLVFSTVGDRRVFERLPLGRVKPALALSLHSTRADLRARLMPKAPRIDPTELVEYGEAYARATGYPVQVQWTLLAGVNDGPDEIEGIARLLAGKYAVLNMIPFNAIDAPSAAGYRRPDREAAAAIARELHARGVLTKLRRSAGQDVAGGCGQLRARALPAPPGPRVRPDTPRR